MIEVIRLLNISHLETNVEPKIQLKLHYIAHSEINLLGLLIVMLLWIDIMGLNPAENDVHHAPLSLMKRIQRVLVMAQKPNHWSMKAIIYKPQRMVLEGLEKNDKYQEAIAALRSCSRGRRSRSCQPPSFPQCRTYSDKQIEASIKVPNYSGISPRPDSFCVTSSCEMNHNSDTAQEKSKEIREKSRCMKKESDATVREIDLSLDPFRLKPSLVDSEGIYNRANGDKVLKYTFQRKRKKEVLTKLDNNITPEQGHAVKLQKTIVNDEHAMDSKQLLQVAQQVIALSGNGPSS